MDEKTIGVDRSCNEGYLPMDNSSNDINNENLENFPPIISDCEHEGAHEIAVSSDVKGSSYQEALLEKGKEENPDEKMENRLLNHNIDKQHHTWGNSGTCCYDSSGCSSLCHKPQLLC